MAKTPASRTPGSRPRPRARTRLPIVLVSLGIGAGGGLLASWIIDHVRGLNDQIAAQAARADRAERSARDAAAERDEAEAAAATAQEQAADADERAAAAQEQAADADERAATAIERAADARTESLAAQAQARQAREQAEAARQAAEAEMDRLNDALGRIAETRRNARGLVMNLDEGSLKFDFDRADLRPESRETLALIAGILFTSEDFGITISGHTDARGSATYNQRLSERRAQAVADYLIGAGLSRERFTVHGRGKTEPLDTGDSDEAHARNRRVEIGIVSARIIDPRQVEP